MKRKLQILFVLLFMGWGAMAQTATAPSGTGTSGDPYLIATLENLYWITASDAVVPSPTQVTRWTKYYTQTANIDASATSAWFSGAGWMPIGDYTTEFSGNYDGGGHTINELFINRPTTDMIGLFGHASNYADGVFISNLGVVNAQITGSSNVGGLIGMVSYYLHVSKCYTTGSVHGGSNLGGMIGYMNYYNSQVTNCYSSVSISSTNSSWDNLGGFIGYDEGQTPGNNFTNCYATGVVPAGNGRGGFMGAKGFGYTSTISNCFWDKESSGITTSAVGTGKTTLQMLTQSTFTGWNFTAGTGIWAMSSNVVSDGYPHLQWENISPPVATAPAQVSTVYQIGTLDELRWIAENSTRWAYSYAQTANINASATSGWDGSAGWTPIGNITTQFSGSYNGQGFAISGLFINRPAANYIGLFGRTTSPATISNLGITGVNITGQMYTGGLVGYNFLSTISKSYCTGTVASTNINIGGLVGHNRGGTISRCYSTATVTGTNICGGFVGSSRDDGTSNGLITDCYSTGNLTFGSTGGTFGGFAGGNYSFSPPHTSTIQNCYSTGSVANMANKGFLGDNTSGTFINNFWDKETSGQLNTGGTAGQYATGKTTAEMKNKATFTGWDFATPVWSLKSSYNGGYPNLDGQADVIKTVGTGGDYATLSLAFAAINAGTIKGAITLQIIGGNAANEGAILYESGHSGLSDYSSLLIYPTVSGLVLSRGYFDALIELNGADNVTFDGRLNQTGEPDITYKNTNTGGPSISFVNGATNNVIKYCKITSQISFGLDATGSGNDNNIVEYNNIDNLNLHYYAIRSYGTALKENSSNIIRNNNFLGLFYPSYSSSYGIILDVNNTDWTIAGNSFYETSELIPTRDDAYYYSIYIKSGNNYTITGNYIGGMAPQCGGLAMTKTGAKSDYFYGIYLKVGSVTASNIKGNTIRNISWANATYADFYAIYANSGAVNIGGETPAEGNIIGSATGTGSITLTNGASGGSFYGIYFTSSITNIKNNTIDGITVANAATNATDFRGIYNSASSGTAIISNNVIGNTITINSINASSASSNDGQLVYGIQSEGSNTVTISGNTIANMTNGSTSPNTFGGIYGIETTDGTNSVTDNTIRDLKVASNNSGMSAISSVIGISQTSSLAGQSISGNTIYNLSNSYSAFEGSVIGLYYSGPTSGTNSISKNFIHSLSVTGTSIGIASIYGILMQAGNSTWSNNIVSLGGDSKIDIFGICENCDASDINSLYFNTVYIGGTLAAGGYSSFAFYSFAATNTRVIKNNIFDNARSNGGVSGTHYAIYLDYVANDGLTLDNNDLKFPT